MNSINTRTKAIPVVIMAVTKQKTGQHRHPVPM
jgi:hypothetical protein